MAKDEPDIQAEADRMVLKHHAPVGVVVNGHMEVVQFRGRTTPYLEPAPGKPSLNLLKMARNGLAIELRTLVAAAAKKDGMVTKAGVSFEGDGHERTLNLSVTPLGEKRQREKRFFLVLFDDVTPRGTLPDGITAQRKTKGGAEDKQASKRQQQELAQARDALRTAIESEDSLREEFQSANEEILSANEELQSTNEELETSKEELQSANEELSTVNIELRNKNNELHDLNNDFSNLLNSTRIPIVMLDRSLRIRRLTATAHRLFKALPSDVGRPFADIKLNIEASDLTPRDLEQTIAKVLDSLQPEEREVRDQDGHWHGLSVMPYRTQDNKIDGVVLALQDIDVVKQSERYLQTIIENIPTPLLVLDADLRVRFANETFCVTFSVSRGETIGQLLYRLGNEQWNIPGLLALLERVLPDRKLVRGFSVTHDFPRIGRKTMVASGRRIEDIVGHRSPLILLTIEDITERAEAEEKSQDLQQRLEQQWRTYFTTLSSISDFAYTFDREGRFLYVNKPLLELWGLTLEEAVGKNFYDLKYEDELAAKLQRQIQQVFDTGKSLSDETAYTNPRGRTGYYEYIFNPVFGADGEVELVAGSTHDLTERKQAEAALIKSGKLAAAGRLAATLAHEINNPLQAVTNLMDLLRRSSKIGADDRAYADTAAEELNRVTHLTRQALSFYRETTSPVAINVEELLTGILSLYAKNIAAKKIVVNSRYEAGGTSIDSFPGAIRQVLSTLLINAMEAVQDGGTIAIHVRKSSHRGGGAIRGIRITMTDNGGGITPADMPRIFEPFFTTKGERGTGLGLWVAQGIISSLGGTISLRSSVRTGKSGSCFSIFLPTRIPDTR